MLTLKRIHLWWQLHHNYTLYLRVLCCSLHCFIVSLASSSLLRYITSHSMYLDIYKLQSIEIMTVWTSIMNVSSLSNTHHSLACGQTTFFLVLGREKRWSGHTRLHTPSIIDVIKWVSDLNNLLLLWWYFTTWINSQSAKKRLFFRKYTAPLSNSYRCLSMYHNMNVWLTT